MEISRELAIKILRYLDEHKDFYFPFLVMNREYTEEDDDFVEVEPDEWEMISGDETYQTFQLWENLQNVHKEKPELLAKVFLEKITDDSLERHVAELARNYSKSLRKRVFVFDKESIVLIQSSCFGTILGG